MKKAISMLIISILAFSMVGCNSQSKSVSGNGPKPGKQIVVGFSQVGAESAWRTAVTKSVKEEFAKNSNYKLEFSDGQQKQENQIKAMRTFITQKVDLIILSPVVQTGWDAVLDEAKTAKIPVMIANRALKMSNGKNPQDYYVTLIAPDNVVGGQKAAQFLVDSFKTHTEDVNVAVLEGTVGSAPAMDRKLGFEDVMKSQSKFKIIKSQSGDFTRAKGKEVMETFLKSTQAEGKKIDALYCHNDDMAIGAIQAIEAAGLKPGKDIMIVSNDGVKDAFQAMVDGKLNATVDNPAGYGPILIGALNDYFAKKTVPKWIKLENTLYPASTAAQELPKRTY